MNDDKAAERVNEVELGEVHGDLVPIREAQGQRRAIKLIEPGWSTSRYWPAEVLERDGPAAFPAGTHMYLDHADEEAANEILKAAGYKAAHFEIPYVPTPPKSALKGASPESLADALAGVFSGTVYGSEMSDAFVLFNPARTAR